MIVLLGSAGAGKSVQSQLLSQTLGYQWVSTGMLLRAHTDESLRNELNAGKLITDDVVEDILARAISSYAHPGKVVLDGFPRKPSQAGWLVNWAEDHAVKIEAVVHLLVTPETARQRLKKRQRDDDTEEVITRRFKEYEANTQAIISNFIDHKVPIIEVDANLGIDDVNEQVKKALAGKLTEV